MGAACAALALASAPAFADNFNGYIGGQYTDFDFNHGGGNVNDEGVNAAGAFNFSPNWALQLGGAYNHTDGHNSNGNSWNIDGTPFWNLGQGRVGATVGYTSISDHGSVDATHYGAFGEWYATRAITVGVKGGAFTANHDANGDYFGGEVTGYITPNFALEGSYDYAHVQHVTNENDYTAQAEWLFSRSVPVSIYGGYTRSDFSGAGNVSANVWFIGLRLYCNGQGEALVDRQRTGAEIYGTHFGPTALHF